MALCSMGNVFIRPICLQQSLSYLGTMPLTSFSCRQAARAQLEDSALAAAKADAAAAAKEAASRLADAAIERDAALVKAAAAAAVEAELRQELEASQVRSVTKV